MTSRNLERDLLLGQRPLGPDDPLGDRGLRGQERPGDLVGRQAADQAQRERRAGLGLQHGMAGDEDEPQQVVADVVIDVRLLERLRVRFHVAPYFLEFLLVPGAAPDQVDGPVLGRRHQPGAGPVRDTPDGPLFQRDHQGVLGEFLRGAHVPGDPGQGRDEAGRLDPPDRLDRGVRGPVVRHRRPAPSPAGRLCSRSSPATGPGAPS
jgi:hypothetical protein